MRNVLYFVKLALLPLVNDLIAIIGEAEEDVNSLLASTASIVGATDTGVAQPSLPSDHFFASPLAKKIAKEKGYDITQIQGSGEAGRVVKKDVVHFAPDRLDTTWMGAQSMQSSYQDLFYAR